jgi:hypothetical protein
MKIPGLNPYQAAYINGYSNGADGAANVQKPQQTGENASMKTDKKGAEEGGDLLTRNEREFFIKLFPQNSEQIENHVLFNRQGRTQSHNIQKGMIVDGRV